MPYVILKTALAKTNRIRKQLLCRCIEFAVLLVFHSPAWSDETFGPGASEPKTPPEQYGEGVRPSGPLAPEEELAGFHVPPGFDVELVAAEPAIQKPLNMAFDTRGRLWVTNTVEYPYPASHDRKPRDSIRILEDANRDGVFEKVTTFADELNIPIGILPTRDGAIAFSIPDLVELRDSDGDGRCDQRKTLLGPFDTSLDTHGMVNSLRMGVDGWIYACHGFNNESKVQAADGSEVNMRSGNTFRFRGDGSRIEHVSYGQVNPFGMTTDRWGNWFTADCHSKPITQILRGAYFSSFGRPDDGLGFVPSMMEHSHGSTAISGLELYDAASYPLGYRDQFYSGNVMTSRVNRNAIEEHGATLRAKELPDFLTSDDPWFRPVDIQLGPDGALYVADFYNKIIGHYEVPLTHPERDRERGRIWRIVYRGQPPERMPSQDASSKSSMTDDFLCLSDANATIRRLARERIRLMEDSVALNQLRDGLQNSEPMLRIECGWELARRGKLTNSQRLALLRDNDATVRAHALQIVSELTHWTNGIRRAVRLRIQDSDPRVVRFAVEAIGKNTESSDVLLLLERIDSITPKDPILRQAIRIAVRDALSQDKIATSFDAASILQNHSSADDLADILLGLHTPRAATWLMSFLKDNARPIHAARKIVSHVASQISDEEFSDFIELLKQRSPDLETEQDLFLLTHGAKGQRSEEAARLLANWGGDVAEKWYRHFVNMLGIDANRFVEWFSSEGEGWPSEKRAATDKVDDQWYRSSSPLGEKYIGTLQSASFAAPPQLTFWIVGHNGPPKTPDVRKNRVRLIDDVTKTTIHEAYPPRSDIAVRIEWDLKEWKDRSVHFECRDLDDRKAYAWIGIGRFDFPPLQSSTVQRNLEEGLKLIRAVRPANLADDLYKLAMRDDLGARAQCDVIEAWATLRENVQISQLAMAMRMFPISSSLLQRLLDAMTIESVDRIGAEMIKTISTDRSLPEQRNLAKLLAKKRASMPWLLQGLRDGWLSAEVLRDVTVKQGIESLAEPDDREKVDAMLASLPSMDANVEDLAKKIATKMEVELGNVENGALLFQKNCANCHQLGGQGSLIGPQLDGAVVRSSSRLLEDILFPDRNVDQAFRMTSLLIDDEWVRVGLLRNESADFVELVENNGKTVRISVDSISERKLSPRSLMPSGLQEALGEEGLIDLLSFLQSNRKTSPPPQ